MNLRPRSVPVGGFLGAGKATLTQTARSAAEQMAPGTDSDFSFLFQIQIAEADLVCVKERNLDGEGPRSNEGTGWQAKGPAPRAFESFDISSLLSDIGNAPLRDISAVTGIDVAQRLDEILAGEPVVAAGILNVDHERYVRAEESLRHIGAEQLRRLPGRFVTRTLECFRPSPPKPPRRLSYVVEGSH